MKFTKQQIILFIFGIFIPYILFVTVLILSGYFKKLFGK